MKLSNRFGRDYKLIITLSDSEAVEIIPEIRVHFEVNKSVKGGLNNCTIKIYNLTEDKRKKLIKDKSSKERLQFLLKAGYEKIETIFKGDIQEASTSREGADFITTIKSFDGGHDFKNSFTSKTVTNNKIDNILSDMPNTQKGRITEQKKLVRPKVLVGNSAKLIEESLSENETYYIDEGKLHIIKDDEVTSDYMPLVQSDTGLLNVPTKKDKNVSFSTLLNPFIKIGGLLELKSEFSTNLNGVYKVLSIKYVGDNYGSDWSQDCTCVLAENYKVIQ